MLRWGRQCLQLRYSGSQRGGRWGKKRLPLGCGKDSGSGGDRILWEFRIGPFSLVIFWSPSLLFLTDGWGSQIVLPALKDGLNTGRKPVANVHQPEVQLKALLHWMKEKKVSRARGAQVHRWLTLPEEWRVLEAWGELGSAKGCTRKRGPGHVSWPAASPLDVSFTFLPFPTSSSLFLWWLLLHQLLFLLIAFLAFTSTCSSTAHHPHPPILLSLCHFFFLSIPVPSCLLRVSLISYLHVPTCPLFTSELGRRHSFSVAFLMMWKGISCVSGYPRKQNPSFWMGQITHCVCKTANQRESSLHVCPSRDWEYSGLSLWAGSGEHWPHFHAVLILCNYTYPWSFSFSPFIFFKTSVLIFSSVFHVSPYSLSSFFFFSYLLEIASIPCLVSLFCFGG